MGGKKKTPTAPAAHAGTPDDSGGTEPEKQRSEDAGSDSDSRRREAALREADSSLHLRSREKRDDREVSCCEHIARPTCFIREACCTSSQCAFCLSLFIFFLFATPTPIWPHFGVGRLHTLYPVNREAVPLVHIFCFLFFFSHTPLSFERESRQKRFSYSATREAAKWGSVKTVPGSRFSCNRRVFLRRPLLAAAPFSLKHVQPFPINGCTGGSYRRLMCLYMRNGSCQ
jgi:hypothetical protein